MYFSLSVAAFVTGLNIGSLVGAVASTPQCFWSRKKMSNICLSTSDCHSDVHFQENIHVQTDAVVTLRKIRPRRILCMSDLSAGRQVNCIGM